MVSPVLTVRLARRDAERIDALVDEGEFQSRSDFLRFAVKSTIHRLANLEVPDALQEVPLGGLGAVGGASADVEAPRRGAKRARSR